MKKMCLPIITEFDEQLPYYFRGVGCFYEQEEIIRPYGHPNFQWIQCRSGKGELILNGTKYIIEKGRGMLLFPNEPHEYRPIDNEWVLDWIIFSGQQIELFVREILKTEHSEVYYITSPDILSDRIEELYKAALSPTNTKNLMCSVLVYAALTDILRLTSITQNASIVNKISKTESVLNYISEHYTEQLSLIKLAEITELTPQYLCSTFKKHTSQTLFEYINMLRIRKSKELLLDDKNMQIKEIAYVTGFNSVSYFGSVFKKIEHMNPTDFRALYMMRQENDYKH